MANNVSVTAIQMEPAKLFLPTIVTASQQLRDGWIEFNEII